LRKKKHSIQDKFEQRKCQIIIWIQKHRRIKNKVKIQNKKVVFCTQPNVNITTKYYLNNKAKSQVEERVRLSW